jgi:hypothetical protein
MHASGSKLQLLFPSLWIRRNKRRVKQGDMVLRIALQQSKHFNKAISLSWQISMNFQSRQEIEEDGNCERNVLHFKKYHTMKNRYTDEQTTEIKYYWNSQNYLIIY